MVLLKGPNESIFGSQNSPGKLRTTQKGNTYLTLLIKLGQQICYMPIIIHTFKIACVGDLIEVGQVTTSELEYFIQIWLLWPKFANFFN